MDQRPLEFVTANDAGAVYGLGIGFGGPLAQDNAQVAITPGANSYYASRHSSPPSEQALILYATWICASRLKKSSG